MKKLFLILTLSLFGLLAKSESTWPEKQGYKFTSNWFEPGKIATWEKHLGHLRNKEKVAYLEVGVWEGRSLLWTLDHILTSPSASAVAVDFFPSAIEPTFRANLKKSGHEKKVRVINKRSEEALRELKPESFDFIYLDGAHDVKTVLIDAINSWYLLKPGGILIFDDYKFYEKRFPESLTPKVAIDIFLLGFGKTIQVLEKGEQVLIQKLPEPTPWCHFCSWFGDFRYEWYKRRLHHKTPEKSVDLSTGQAQELEETLRQLDKAEDSKKIEKLRGEAIELAKRLTNLK